MATIDASLLIRPMRRSDLDAMSGWDRHADALFAAYNVPVLSREDGDAFWGRVQADTRTLMLAADADGRFVAHIIVRNVDRAARTGDLGIALDPGWIGRGLGRRILRSLFRYLLEEEGLLTLTLDVAGYNYRAVRAYRAAGFAETRRRFVQAEGVIDYLRLLRDPAYAWLAPHVDLRANVVRIEILSMRAHLGAALEAAQG